MCCRQCLLVSLGFCLSVFLRAFVASASGALSSFSAALRGAPGNDFWASLVEGPIDAVKALEFSDACGSVGEVFCVEIVVV